MSRDFLSCGGADDAFVRAGEKSRDFLNCGAHASNAFRRAFALARNVRTFVTCCRRVNVRIWLSAELMRGDSSG